MTLYKIRNKATGKYSTGGTYPRWTKGGKTWNSLGDVKIHLALVGPNNSRKYYANCELVGFEQTTVLDFELLPSS